VLAPLDRANTGPLKLALRVASEAAAKERTPAACRNPGIRIHPDTSQEQQVDGVGTNSYKRLPAFLVIRFLNVLGSATRSWVPEKGMGADSP
jgi:hypothetical protein